MHGQRYIRIVRRPEGEAPQWVRDTWIGVVLPLVGDGPVSMRGVGVLTGPRSWWGYWWHRLTGRIGQHIGYEVVAAVAVDILRSQSPDAARWWQTHVAHLLDGQQCFLFDLPACELLD